MTTAIYSSREQSLIDEYQRMKVEYACAVGSAKVARLKAACESLFSRLPESYRRQFLGNE